MTHLSPGTDHQTTIMVNKLSLNEEKHFKVDQAMRPLSCSAVWLSCVILIWAAMSRCCYPDPYHASPMFATAVNIGHDKMDEDSVTPTLILFVWLPLYWGQCYSMCLLPHYGLQVYPTTVNLRIDKKHISLFSIIQTSEQYKECHMAVLHWSQERRILDLCWLGGARVVGSKLP